LIIDADAMLPFAVARKRLQMIPWRDTQLLEGSNGIKQVEFAGCYSPQRERTNPARNLRVLAIEDIFGSGILE